MHPVIAIVGPTGSGKSDLGLRIAREFRGEIISCDSIQVYMGLDVGSAKTPLQAREGIPHHLLDVVQPTEELTAGAYSRLARAALSGILQRGYLPVVVGGTGLYLRAFLEGLSPGPERDEALRERLGAKFEQDSALLYRFLRRYDPASAGRIHVNDRHKMIRAVELTMTGRRPASVTQQEPRDALTGVTVLKIGLHPERKELYDKLNRRSAALFSEGLLEETARALESGAVAESKPMQSLGYKQATAVLTRRLTLPEAIKQCQIRTRQYAKRQLTWFRHDAGVQWLNGFGGEADVQERALAMSRDFLRLF